MKKLLLIICCFIFIHHHAAAQKCETETIKDVKVIKPTYANLRYLFNAPIGDLLSVMAENNYIQSDKADDNVTMTFWTPDSYYMINKRPKVVSMFFNGNSAYLQEYRYLFLLAVPEAKLVSTNNDSMTYKFNLKDGKYHSTVSFAFPANGSGLVSYLEVE
jgi:hypothetical protein